MATPDRVLKPDRVTGHGHEEIALTSRTPDTDQSLTPTFEVPAGLASAFAQAFESLSRDGTVRVPDVSAIALADYPEGAFLPDLDMMATLSVPAGDGISGSAFVSFPPPAALDLIEAWSAGATSGSDAIGCYRRGARTLASAGLAALGLAPGETDTFEEDALVATLLATHAPGDTQVFSATLDVEFGDRNLQGVFVLLVDTKAAAALGCSAAA